MNSNIILVYLSFILIIFYISFLRSEERIVQNSNEIEIGVPDFPYNPEDKKDALIFCAKLCSKKKELCYKNTEYKEKQCEGIFVSCINMCR